MPHLYELRPLPTEVGGVPIVWFDPSKVEIKRREDQAKKSARRERDKILLPSNWDNDFLPLGDGKCLFIQHSFGRSSFPSGMRLYSFCGMDESPFHVFVTWDAVLAYKRGGAEGFFDSLVPPLMKVLRDRPDIPDSYRRQGDWFANRLPFSWGEIEQFVRLGRGQEFKLEAVRKESLDGTRHHFTGRLAREVPLFGWICDVLEGTISAPDHSDLVLPGGPHVIAQAANLADSKNAD